MRLVKPTKWDSNSQPDKPESQKGLRSHCPLQRVHSTCSEFGLTLRLALANVSEIELRHGAGIVINYFCL